MARDSTQKKATDLTKFRRSYMSGKHITVTKDGRIFIPREIVEKFGGRPGDLVDRQDITLRKKGWTRRALIRRSVKAVCLIFAGAGTYASIKSCLDRIWEKDNEADFLLLKRLFGGGASPSESLSPARNHPFRPLKANEPAYPIEAECCAAYIDAFYKQYSIRKVNGFPQIRPDDSVVIFGSQVSNFSTRAILGNPFSSSVTSYLEMKGIRNRLRIPLRWNLYMPVDAPVEYRRQYGVDWKFRSYVLKDFRCKSSIFSRKKAGEVETDYLLITVLPRYEVGPQKLVIFGGIHGPGTHAAAKIFRQPPMSELCKLEKVLSKAPYYQALFEVSVIKNEKQELEPDKITFLEAEVLQIELS